MNEIEAFKTVPFTLAQARYFCVASHLYDDIKPSTLLGLYRQFPQAWRQRQSYPFYNHAYIDHSTVEKTFYHNLFYCLLEYWTEAPELRRQLTAQLNAQFKAQMPDVLRCLNGKGTKTQFMEFLAIYWDEALVAARYSFDNLCVLAAVDLFCILQGVVYPDTPEWHSRLERFQHALVNQLNPKFTAFQLENESLPLVYQVQGFMQDKKSALSQDYQTVSAAFKARYGKSVETFFKPALNNVGHFYAKLYGQEDEEDASFFFLEEVRKDTQYLGILSHLNCLDTPPISILKTKDLVFLIHYVLVRLSEFEFIQDEHLHAQEHFNSLVESALFEERAPLSGGTAAETQGYVSWIQKHPTCLDRMVDMIVGVMPIAIMGYARYKQNEKDRRFLFSTLISPENNQLAALEQDLIRAAKHANALQTKLDASQVAHEADKQAAVSVLNQRVNQLDKTCRGQMQEIKGQAERIVELERQLHEAQQQLATQTTPDPQPLIETNEEDEKAGEVEQPVDDCKFDPALVDYLNRPEVMFVGGWPQLVQKLRVLFPNAKYYEANTKEQPSFFHPVEAAFVVQTFVGHHMIDHVRRYSRCRPAIRRLHARNKDRILTELMEQANVLMGKTSA